MKSKNRQEMADKAAQRIQRMQERRRERTTTGQTGAEALSAMMGLEVVELPKEEEKEKPDIVLYLKEGLKGATTNWTKYPNEIHVLMAERFDKPAQGVLYTFLWRQSWGYGKNYCRIGYAGILKATCMRSRWEVIDAVSKLKELKFIVQALDENGQPDTLQAGTVYRVMAPQEIADGVTEEGVSLSSIPDNGILCIRIPENNSADIQHTGVLDISIPDNTMAEVDADEQSDQGDGAEIQYTDIQYPLKEDSLKDSLSPDRIVTGFYTGIGQKRISKQKREKGVKVVQELEADSFTLKDIQFAVEWTIKNAKEKPYDFAILKDTIGQAQPYQQAAEKAQKESARISAAEKEESRLEGEMLKIREGMSEDKLNELEEKALKEIRESGEFKAEFITEHLITAKENEILRRS